MSFSKRKLLGLHLPFCWFPLLMVQGSLFEPNLRHFRVPAGNDKSNTWMQISLKNHPTQNAFLSVRTADGTGGTHVFEPAFSESRVVGRYSSLQGHCTLRVANLHQGFVRIQFKSPKIYMGWKSSETVTICSA